MSGSNTGCHGDQESLSDWSLVDNEESAANGDVDEEGNETSRDEEVKEMEMNGDADEEEEKKDDDVARLGQRVEEVKAAAGLSGNESSDIETLDYPCVDYIEDGLQRENLFDYDLGMLDSFSDYVRVLKPPSYSYSGDIDTESLSSEDSPEEKVRKRRARKPEATQDEETDLSLASSPSLPDDLPMIKPDLQYVHTPHEEFNRRLNVIVALTLACVFGLGLGHFLGWSSRSLWESNLNAAQVRKLRQLQDNLLSCMSSPPHDLPDHPNNIIVPPSDCVLHADSKGISAVESDRLNYRDKGQRHFSPVSEILVERIIEPGDIMNQNLILEDNAGYIISEKRQKIDGFNERNYADSNDEFNLGLKTVENSAKSFDRIRKGTTSDIPTHSDEFNNEKNKRQTVLMSAENIPENWDESLYIRAPQEKSFFINPLPEVIEEKIDSDSRPIEVLENERKNGLAKFFPSNDILSLVKGNIEEDIIVESYIRESDNIIRRVVYGNRLFSNKLKANSEEADSYHTRTETRLSLWTPEINYNANSNTTKVFEDYGEDFMNLSEIFERKKNNVNVKAAIALPVVSQFLGFDQKAIFSAFEPSSFDIPTFLPFSDISLIENDTMESETDAYIDKKENADEFCHIVEDSSTLASAMQQQLPLNEGADSKLTSFSISSYPTNSLLLEIDRKKIVEALRLENDELLVQKTDLQSKNFEPFKIRGEEGKQARDLREELNRLISDNEDLRLSLIRNRFSLLEEGDEIEFNKIVEENHQLRSAVARLAHLGPDVDQLKQSLDILKEENRGMQKNMGEVKLEQSLPKELTPVVKQLEEMKALLQEEESSSDGLSAKRENAKSYLAFMNQILDAFSQFHDFDEKSVAEKIETATDVFSSILPKGIKLPPKMQDEVKKSKGQFSKLKSSIHKKWKQLKELTRPGNVMRAGKSTVAKMNRVLVNVVNKIKEIGQSTFMKDRIQSQMEATMTSFAAGLSKLNKHFEESWKSIEIHEKFSSRNNGEANIGHSDDQSNEEPYYIRRSEQNHLEESVSHTSAEASRDDSFNRKRSPDIHNLKSTKTNEEVSDITKDKLKSFRLETSNAKSDSEKTHSKAGNSKIIDKISESHRNENSVKVNDNNKEDARYFKGQYNKYDRVKPKKDKISDDIQSNKPEVPSKSGLNKLWDESKVKKSHFRESDSKKHFIKRKSKKDVHSSRNVESSEEKIEETTGACLIEDKIYCGSGENLNQEKTRDHSNIVKENKENKAKFKNDSGKKNKSKKDNKNIELNEDINGDEIFKSKESKKGVEKSESINSDGKWKSQKNEEIERRKDKSGDKKLKSKEDKKSIERSRDINSDEKMKSRKSKKRIERSPDMNSDEEFKSKKNKKGLERSEDENSDKKTKFKKSKKSIEKSEDIDKDENLKSKKGMKDIEKAKDDKDIREYKEKGRRHVKAKKSITIKSDDNCLSDNESSLHSMYYGKNRDNISESVIEFNSRKHKLKGSNRSLELKNDLREIDSFVVKKNNFEREFKKENKDKEEPPKSAKFTNKTNLSESTNFVLVDEEIEEETDKASTPKSDVNYNIENRNANHNDKKLKERFNEEIRNKGGKKLNSNKGNERMNLREIKKLKEYRNNLIKKELNKDRKAEIGERNGRRFPLEKKGRNIEIVGKAIENFKEDASRSFLEKERKEKRNGKSTNEEGNGTEKRLSDHTVKLEEGSDWKKDRENTESLNLSEERRERKDKFQIGFTFNRSHRGKEATNKKERKQRSKSNEKSHDFLIEEKFKVESNQKFKAMEENSVKHGNSFQKVNVYKKKEKYVYNKDVKYGEKYRSKPSKKEYVQEWKKLEDNADKIRFKSKFEKVGAEDLKNEYAGKTDVDAELKLAESFVGGNFKEGGNSKEWRKKNKKVREVISDGQFKYNDIDIEERKSTNKEKTKFKEFQSDERDCKAKENRRAENNLEKPFSKKESKYITNFDDGEMESKRENKLKSDIYKQDHNTNKGKFENAGNYKEFVSDVSSDENDYNQEFRGNNEFKKKYEGGSRWEKNTKSDGKRKKFVEPNSGKKGTGENVRKEYYHSNSKKTVNMDYKNEL